MGFVNVALASEAPAEGELARFKVNDTAVAVANVSGQLYAFADTCTHAECSLADGDLDDTEVVCVCHAGAFDVTTGEVVAPPPTQPVASYPVRVEDGQLQIDC